MSGADFWQGGYLKPLRHKGLGNDLQTLISCAYDVCMETNTDFITYKSVKISNVRNALKNAQLPEYSLKRRTPSSAVIHTQQEGWQIIDNGNHFTITHSQYGVMSSPQFSHKERETSDYGNCYAWAVAVVAALTAKGINAQIITVPYKFGQFKQYTANAIAGVEVK